MVKAHQSNDQEPPREPVNATLEADGTLTLHGEFAERFEAEAARRGIILTECVNELLRNLIEHEAAQKRVEITGMIDAKLYRKARAAAKARGETPDLFTSRAICNLATEVSEPEVRKTVYFGAF